MFPVISWSRVPSEVSSPGGIRDQARGTDQSKWRCGGGGGDDVGGLHGDGGVL